jgi:hypothetical protein
MVAIALKVHSPTIVRFILLFEPIQLPHHHIIILSHHDIAALPRHYTIKLPHYHITSLPHYAICLPIK